MALLSERALRSLFRDRSNYYSTSLKNAGTTTLYTCRVQDIAILVYKALHNQSSQNIKDLFKLQISNYNLRGTDILTLSKPRTTTYGLESLRYMGPKVWNSLADKIRSAENIC